MAGWLPFAGTAENVEEEEDGGETVGPGPSWNCISS